MGYCSSSPSPSTVHPALHGVVLFIQPSTGSCSSSPPRGPVHPCPTGSIDRGPDHPAATPRGPIHPPLHRHPSMGYCSSSPPRGGPVHPALHGVLFIQPQPARSIRVLFIQRQHHGVLFIHPTGNCSSKPPQQRSLFIQRQHRSALVSSSSEGIARSGSVNSHRSIARVQ